MNKDTQITLLKDYVEEGVSSKFTSVFKVHKDKTGQYISRLYIDKELLRNSALSTDIEIQFPIKEG